MSSPTDYCSSTAGLEVPPADAAVEFQEMERAASTEGLEVDWSTVDPAALASMEMALAMGPNFDGPMAQRDRADAVAGAAARIRAASTANPGATAAVGEATLANELSRLAAELAEVEAQQCADDDADDDAALQGEMGDDPPAADEEEGMGAPAGTAEGSWGGDEEWVLEKVLRRRKARGDRGVSSGVAAADPDMEGDEDDWEYLCRWQGAAACTWERRGFLRECGLGPQVEAFDVETAPKGKTSTRKLRPKKPAGTAPPWIAERQRKAELREERRLALLAEQERIRQELARVERMKHCASAFTRHVHIVSDMSRNLSRYGDDWRYVVERFARSSAGRLAMQQAPRDTPALRDLDVAALLLAMFAQLHADATRVLVAQTRVIDPDTITQLAEFLRAHEAAKLVLVFHGTRSQAIKPIESSGLVVPRPHVNGVSVVNGSVLGLGVYTATAPSTPIQFTRGSGSLFVCIGVANDPHTRQSGSVYVFGEDRLVAPVLRISFAADYGCSNGVFGNSGTLEEFDPPSRTVCC